jgi:ABC-type antimicrobial peptide transport system permease subunit
MARSSDIPEQTPVSWPIVFRVSIAGMQRRFARAVITLTGVVLAIAFLCYMLVSEVFLRAMIQADLDGLNILLQKNDVDIFAGGKTDPLTILLIGLTLLTCLVGIINAMLMAVTERVKEIGTLKCLGATDQFIVRAYFVESTVQGVCGAAFGLLIGFLVALGVSARSYGGYTFQTFPIAGVLVSLVISLMAGAALSIVAAIVPAFMAARKQPIEALRVEE